MGGQELVVGPSRSYKLKDLGQGAKGSLDDGKPGSVALRRDGRPKVLHNTFGGPLLGTLSTAETKVELHVASLGILLGLRKILGDKSIPLELVAEGIKGGSVLGSGREGPGPLVPDINECTNRSTSRPATHHRSSGGIGGLRFSKAVQSKVARGGGIAKSGQLAFASRMVGSLQRARRKGEKQTTNGQTSLNMETSSRPEGTGILR